MASDPMSNGFVLYLTITESSVDKLANTSVVSYSLYINPPGNYTSYNLNSGDQSYSITINGSVVASGGFTYDFRSPNANVNKVIKASTVTVPHNADGSKTVAASAFANTSSATVGDGSIASFDTVLTTFTPGKRWDGTTMAPMSVYKRFDGTGWVNLTSRKRFDGTNWVNISN